jgi:hypothetical protein
VYFPIRSAASPEINELGQNDSSGMFHSYDFQSPLGLWQAINADQFHYLFFASGYIPVWDQIVTIAQWFWQNYLGVGILFGLVGAFYLHRRERGLYVCWVAFLVPYTYFYVCYGAINKDTMLGPSYLVWSVWSGCQSSAESHGTMEPASTGA